MIWEARPVSYYAWSGHEQHANVTQTARAMSLLYALTGSFDQPGGNVLLPAAPAAAITGQELLLAAKGMGPTLGLTERPLGPARWGYYTTRDLYRAIREGKPHPVRAVIGFGANMLLAHADGGPGREAQGIGVLRARRSVHELHRRAGRHRAAGRLGIRTRRDENRLRHQRGRSLCEIRRAA